MGKDSDYLKEQQEEEEKSRLLNTGTYQRREEERARAQFEEVKDMPLARRVGDSQLEERKKNVIREGDPMAMYAWKVRFVFYDSLGVCDYLWFVSRRYLTLSPT
jgi:hypothetical protein